MAQVNLAPKPWGGEVTAVAQEETVGCWSLGGGTQCTSEALGGSGSHERRNTVME
jgi:hypothetical protein